MKVLSAILLSATLSFVSAQTINVTGDLDFGMMNISAPTNFTTGGEVEVSNTTDMPMNTTDMPVIDVDVGTPSPTEEMTMEETFAETSSPTEEMTVEGTFVETFEESTEAPTTTMTVGMEDVNTTAELDEVLETSPTTNETTDDILNEIEDLFDSTQAPVMAPTAEPPVATEIPVEDDLEDPDDVPTNTDTPPVETLAPNTCAVEEGATGEACGELLATTTALCDCKCTFVIIYVMGIFRLMRDSHSTPLARIVVEKITTSFRLQLLRWYPD